VCNADTRLAEKARNGDEDSFTRLVETYQTPVYNLVTNVGEGTAAEDAAQETFWRA